MKRLWIAVLVVLAAVSDLAVTVRAQSGDIRRHTVAVTYLKDPVKVLFAGTTLRPSAKGEAKVERWRKRNETEIEMSIENMIPAFNFGGDYNTYVLWAITPEGQTMNLGEFRLSASSAHLNAATPLQTFAMIVTAEPHYLVRMPSRMVVLENMTPNSKNVQVQTSEVYFTGDSGRYYTDTTVPEVAERDYNKTPMELLQARRAVQIAKLADGERFDPNDFKAAQQALSEAEEAFRQGANVHEVGRIARDAISLAVKTRDVSEERAEAAAHRAEIARRDEEVRRVSENASDLTAKLSDTETRLRASELARTNTENQLNQALRDAAEARASIRSLQDENQRLRAELDRKTREAADLQAQLQSAQSQYSTVSAKLNEASSRAEAAERAERERREAETRRRDYADLQSSLGRILSVTQRGDGFTAVLPDTYFVTNRTELALRVKAKMDELAQVLSAHPYVTFTIVGHSDARPTADDFARARAQAVADYISALGVKSDNFKVESRGAMEPASSLRTLKGRALNRRVELIFSVPR